jgi:hypothetical protein
MSVPMALFKQGALAKNQYELRLCSREAFRRVKIMPAIASVKRLRDFHDRKIISHNKQQTCRNNKINDLNGENGCLRYGFIRLGLKMQISTVDICKNRQGCTLLCSGVIKKSSV